MSREVALKTLAGTAVIWKCDRGLGICFQNRSLVAGKSVLAVSGSFCPLPCMALSTGLLMHPHGVVVASYKRSDLREAREMLPCFL